MTSPHKLMKNIWMKVVLKYQNSTIIQRKDIANLVPKVAKQWKLRSNGHLTYQVMFVTDFVHDYHRFSICLAWYILVTEL